MSADGRGRARVASLNTTGCPGRCDLISELVITSPNQVASNVAQAMNVLAIFANVLVILWNFVSLHAGLAACATGAYLCGVFMAPAQKHPGR